MRTFTIDLALSLLALTSLSTPSAAAPPSGAALLERGKVGAEAITAEAMSAHIRFLADDLLEGRAPGTRGHALGEIYVATQLQALGVLPGGERGSWTQDVPLRSFRVVPETSWLELFAPGPKGTKGAAVPIVPELDYLVGTDGDDAKVDREAELVYAGFGIVAPEYGWDDLKGVDLRGKVAVLLGGAPGPGNDKFFPPVPYGVYSDNRAKMARLAEKGAVGVLHVWTPVSEQRIPWKNMTVQARNGRTVLVQDGHQISSPRGLTVRGQIHGTAFDRLLAAAGAKVRLADLMAAAQKGKRLAVPALGTVHTHVEVELQDKVSHNVIGVLKGSDPALSSEYVLYSAHLDHLGVGAPQNGDAIYNGAMDDAAGVATLLETARAFRRLDTGPRRSVLFVAVTAEESGLLGSEWLARHPVVAGDSIVANVNLDGTPCYGPLLDLVAIGGPESTLDAHLAAAASSLGLKVSPDPEPEKVFIIRSDQWSFIREAGIPAIFVGDGNLDESGGTERKKALGDRWVAERYHRPTDAWDPTYDYGVMARYTQAMFLLGLSIAETPERPTWKDTSFFKRYTRPVAATK